MFPIQTELAWAAGFFDGEGCIYVAGTDYRLSIAQTDPRPLARFVEALGSGKVNGPYSSRQPNHKDKWVVSYSTKDSCRVLVLLWPYLSEPKREQAQAQLRKRQEQKKAFLARLKSTRGPKGHLVSLALADLEMCST